MNVFFNRQLIENAIMKFIKLILFLAVNIWISNSYAEEEYKYYVFISSTIPKQSLIQILEQSKKINAEVVLRGFINNSHKVTTETFQDLINITQYGVIVDPELFTKYQITKVPTFVIAKGDQYDKLAGNISWQEAIEIITRKGEVYAEQ